MTQLTYDQLAGSPEAWLLVLLRSIRQGDLATAADAQDRLREMGIDVEFASLRPAKSEEVDDA